MQELDLETLFQGSELQQKRKALTDEITAIEGDLVSWRLKRDRTYELLSDPSMKSDFLAEKLRECEARIAEIEADATGKKAELTSLQTEIDGFYESRDQLKPLIAKLQAKDDDEVYLLRAQVASRLKALVTILQVGAAGSSVLTERAIRMLAEIARYPEGSAAAEDRERVADHMRQVAGHERSRRRFFAIGFKDGRARIVYPHPDDPMRFDEQIVTSTDGMHRIDGEAGRLSQQTHRSARSRPNISRS